MTISPGTMKARPPTTAPSRPRTRHAQKMASSVEAGPGSRLQAAIASSSSAASSQPSRSTHSRRSSAMRGGRAAEPGDPDPAPLAQHGAQPREPGPVVLAPRRYRHRPFYT